MLTVAIVNDSAIAIETLRRALLTSQDYKLLWVAQTGREAIQYCAQQCPDLLLMDMHMPNLNGVEATRQIMHHSPCVILIVTASITKHSTMVFEAMSHGALDVVKTPRLGTDNPKAINRLLRKMAILAKHTIPSTETLRHISTSNPQQRSRRLAQHPKLIVIGASTGGPGALQTIFNQLPQDFDAAIIVIQHINEQFTSGLVHWLNQSSKLPVTQIRNGDYPKVGQILLAGGNKHLVMRPNHSLRYTCEPTHYPYHPSVDVFFHSVADHWEQPGTAALLTGMGKDGALGLKHLWSANWHTIAESKDSCVVFGMPKAAIEQGAAKHILSLNQVIAHFIGAIP